MAGCQIDVLPGDISDIILKKKVSYKPALYALAYIPTDPWRVDSYDADYNVVTTVRPDARQYKAYAALTDLLLRSPTAADDPVSRCDVLRQFAAARHGD